MIADPRPSLRDMIADNINILSYHVASAHNYATVGDDIGLEYAIRKVVEFTKHSAALTSDLIKENREAQKSEAA